MEINLIKFKFCLFEVDTKKKILLCVEVSQLECKISPWVPTVSLTVNSSRQMICPTDLSLERCRDERSGRYASCYPTACPSNKREQTAQCSSLLDHFL